MRGLTTLLLLLLGGAIAWLRGPSLGPLRYRLGGIPILGAAAGVPEMYTVHGDRVTLHPRPGGCDHSGCLEMPATDSPSTTLAVTLPLYPGAIASDQPMAPGLSYGISPYLAAAIAKFRVPAPRDTVQSWYQQQFTALGYGAGFGGGYGSDFQSGEIATMSSFTPPGTDGMQIELATEPLTHTVNQALIMLAAITIRVPPRDPASFVPTNATDLVIQYGNQGNTPSKERRLVIRDHATLQRFITLVNGLPHGAYAAAGGTLDPGSFFLTFDLPNHQTMRFSEFACCEGVSEAGFPSLDDPRHQLLGALFAVTGPH